MCADNKKSCLNFRINGVVGYTKPNCKSSNF